jgi:hypothetical protein
MPLPVCRKNPLYALYHPTGALRAPELIPRVTLEKCFTRWRQFDTCHRLSRSDRLHFPSPQELPSDTPLIRTRPFRALHHTISHAGVRSPVIMGVGGGQPALA